MTMTLARFIVYLCFRMSEGTIASLLNQNSAHAYAYGMHRKRIARLALELLTPTPSSHGPHIRAACAKARACAREAEGTRCQRARAVRRQL